MNTAAPALAMTQFTCTPVRVARENKTASVVKEEGAGLGEGRGRQSWLPSLSCEGSRHSSSSRGEGGRTEALA